MKPLYNPLVMFMVLAGLCRPAVLFPAVTIFSLFSLTASVVCS
ncbi:MAG: hypothetical protein QTN59_20710 [Candidatus Electrothrix communis]|nr:MAG: hypothetical protein QTN59_20710 [Candidatus Electrothrix communis]